MRCRNSKNMRQHELAFIEVISVTITTKCSSVKLPLLYENTLFLGTVIRCSENQLGLTM